MAEQNYSIERDLNEVQAMVDSLVPYVYQDELYGRVSMNMPALTIGAILMRLRRLRALADKLTPAQLAALEQAEAAVRSASQEWKTHFEKKLAREAEARLRDILTYTQEWKDNPRASANAYMPEALRRTMAEEVMAALPDADRDNLKLLTKRADSELRRYVQESDFIWADDLRAAYPADRYWWLYKRPPKTNGDNR